MTNKIVTVNVSQQSAPAPSTLQRTGALISQGATNKDPGTLTLLTQLSDLTAILESPLTISALTWADNVVTITTATPHGWTVSETVGIVVAGATPTGYNGTFQGTVVDTTTITYPLASNPGSATSTGTVILEDKAELLAMGTTFFDQGGALSVYVLELGEGDVADGVEALGTYLTDNPGTLYSVLVPREWDADEGFLALIANYNSTTSKFYFFVTTTVETYTSYTDLMKCVFKMVEAPAIPSTEFSCAAPFYDTLNYSPSSTNKVTPLAFSFLFGVTPYPTAGNSALLSTLKTANVNYVGTGAEGQISNTILFWGHLSDGNPFNYWYSVDWAQINIGIALANAVINGSNNPLAPLDYNQAGINSLQVVAAKVFSNAVTFGLAIGSVKQTQLSAAQFEANFEAGLYDGQLVVNAEPFATYIAENPEDYAAGRYGGFAGVYTPQRGFESILFDLTATTFA